MKCSQYGTSKLADATSQEGVPILGMKNITYEGKLDLSGIKFIQLSDNDMSKYLLHEGDILFNRTNSQELVGKTAFYEEKNGKCIFASYLIRFRVDGNKVIPKYVSYFMNSKFIKEKLMIMAKPSVNMSNINATEMASIAIKVPSLEKQNEVVVMLDTQFEVLANLHKIKACQERVIAENMDDIWDAPQ